MILSCKNISKSYGTTTILKNINFLIEEGEKVAVIGVNGAGKTTLFKLITNEISPDEGEIIFRKNSKIGYLSQMKDLCLDNTIYDEMLTVFEDLIKIESELRYLEIEMSHKKNDELNKIMERYSRLNHEFEELNGYEYKSRIKGVIKGLGFSDSENNEPIRHLSGGQKTRISLGKLLLTAPDLLLLDEPTNHLDIESVNWLEDSFLKNYSGAVLVISHDRYFLDKIVHKVIEIENGISSIYNGNYTYYAFKKEEVREIHLKQYLDQQKEIKRQQEVIKQLKSFNREKSIKRAESREKMLEKIDKIPKPENAPEKIRIILEPNISSGNDVLHVENVSKTFNNEVKPLFKNVSFDITKGEKVALIGANGIGKSTLFKMITKSIEFDQGIIQYGSNVNIAYYDQEYALLDENKTIFQEISDDYPKLKDLEIRSALAAFVFTGDDVFKTISTLSGGEKGRVALCKLMLSNSNFLLLDEPTNHLDMYSKEILEEALRNYMGTVMYISHDRYFINNTADKILELTKNSVNLFLGNYDYYIEKKEEQLPNLLSIESNTNLKSSNKSDWIHKKEKQSEKRKVLTRIKTIEKEISIIENRIENYDLELLKEEIYTDHIKASEILEEKNYLENKLLCLYEEWQTLQ